MTTENTYPEFLETSENLESMDQFMHLLNFWHISKINKEQGFIKRHGLHPVLCDFIQTKTEYSGNGMQEIKHNSFSLEGSSDIQKMVFTVFRIYLEKQFENYDVSKVRDVPTWVFTLENDAFGLDNPVFLRMTALRMNDRLPTFNVIKLEDLSARGYRNYRNDNKFSLQYSDLSRGLVIPLLEQDLTQIETQLSTQVDDLIENRLQRLMGHDKFLENLGIDPKAKAKVPRKKKVDNETEFDVSPTGRAVPATPTTISPEVQSLVELYRTLGSPIENLGTSDLFNYLVSYMRVANPERRVPLVTATTLREFETAIRNAA